MERLLGEMRLALEGSGFEDKVYIVGGLVRDTLLGREAADPDFMIDGDPAAVCRLLAEKGFGDRPSYLPEFYSAKLCRGNVLIEMTGGRAEIYTPGSRRPATRPAPLEEDAFRRDFTVNALYRHLFSGEILDPTGMGLADLQAGVLRTPIDPGESFRQDPLRILRGIRFAAQLDMELSPGTARAAAEAAGETDTLSADRRREELTRLLLLPDPCKGLRLLAELGIMPHLLPGLEKLAGYTSRPGSDVWEHTLKVVRGVKAEPALRYSALLHDISKPRVAKTLPDGSLSFPGHAAASAEMARELLSGLGMPAHVIHRVCRLIEEHNCFFKCSGDRDFRYLIHKNRDVIPELLRLMKSDKLAAAGGPERLEAMLKTYDRLRTPDLLQKELSPLSGEELRRDFGLTGKSAGRAKALLRESVLRGSLSGGDREEAKRLVAKSLEEGSL